MKTATAKDVHNECDKEAESLVKEAHLVIERSKKKDNVLIAKLKKMGFGNSSSIAKEERAKKTADDTLRCKLLYPQNNFLTEEAIEKICKKYGLLFTRPQNFIGEMPVKNQIEIANFKLADEDTTIIAFDREQMKASWSKVKSLKADIKKSDLFGQIMLGISLSMVKSAYTKMMSKKDFLKANDNNLSFRQEKTPDFQIIATPENISLKNAEVVGDYKVVDKDPVVFCKVNGGYLQVSAWGDEASLEEFQTPAKN